MVDIFVEGRKLDVSDEMDFSFNYSIADIRNPDTRSTEYTKTIECPATQNNDILFGHIYDLNISNPHNPSISNIDVNFNPNKKADVEVLHDGVRVMKGTIQLRRIKQDGNATTYEVVFIGQLVNIFSVLGDKQLSGNDVNGVNYIDFSDLDHEYTRANQHASWGATVGEGYVYPMMDWGNNVVYHPSGNRIYYVEDFRPALYAKEILDRIFDFAGFTYTSSFLDSSFFKRMIIPTTKNMGLSAAQINQRSFKAVKVEHQRMHRLETQSPSTVGNEMYMTNWGYMARLCFEDDFNLGFDNDNNWKQTSVSGNLQGAYGNYEAVSVHNHRVDNYQCSVDLRIQKNHASVPRDIYTGDVRIVKIKASDGSTNVMYSSPFYFDGITALSVGSTVLQTVVVEGEIEVDAGDEVFVDIVAGSTTEGFASDFRNYISSSGLYWLEFNCTGGYFLNTPVPTEIYEGDTTDIANGLPSASMSDFFMSLVKMFNLYVLPNPEKDNDLIIETYTDFYAGGGVKDWSHKLDYSKDVVLQPLALLTAGEYEYTYTEDGDYYNDRYQSNHSHVHGRRLYSVDNDFLQNKHTTEIVFSPSPLVNDGNSNRLIPKIYDSDIEEGVSPTDANIRILYYGGKLLSNWWTHASRVHSDNVHYNYPYAGHLTHPITPAQDIHFGLPLELFYAENDNTGPISITTNNLFNTFHRRYLDEITDKDSKLLTAYFYLEPLDIHNLDFSDNIIIDNSYWRLNKIENYNPFKESIAKVELLKVVDKPAFSTKSLSIKGTGSIDDEKYPSKPKKKSNSNHYPDFQGAVRGRNNNIDPEANNFEVNGDNNTIERGADNITIRGNNNIVREGVTNVTLIGSDNITVERSHTTFINNQPQDWDGVIDSGEDGDPSFSEVPIYLIDSSGDEQYSNSAIYLIDSGEI